MSEFGIQNSPKVLPFRVAFRLSNGLKALVTVPPLLELESVLGAGGVQVPLPVAGDWVTIGEVRYRVVERIWQCSRYEFAVQIHLYGGES